MTWETRELDVHDDALMHRLYEILHAASIYERPDAPMWSEKQVLLEFRENDPQEKVTAHGAFEGDELVGGALHAAFLLDNTEKAFVEIWVEPERRRQGIGSALATHLADLTRAQGRTTMLAQSFFPFERRHDHPYVRFAEKNGYAVALTQVRRDLQLPVPMDKVQAWIDEAAPHHDGYRIETYEGMLPSELLPSFVHAVNQINVDAPQGDETWEPEAMTPETFEMRHKNHVKAGRRLFHTVGIHEASNEVVGYTTLTVVADNEHDIYQWGTLVRRDHRGHWLGLAVKARALADLQRADFGRKRITTTNAEVNAQMVGINERMGFEVIELEGEFQRLLS